MRDYEGFRGKVKDFFREFKKQLEHKISGSMGVLHETLSRLQTVLGAEIHARECCNKFNIHLFLFIKKHSLLVVMNLR